MEAAGKRHIVHASERDWLKIWNLADLHTFNRACARDLLAADVAEIGADPYSFWFCGGDYGDYIGLDDKRFDPDCVAEFVGLRDMGKLGRAQAEHVKKLLWPIRGKCLGMLMGNHEKQFEIHARQSDLHAWLCEELGVANLQYCALVDVVFQRSLRKGAKPKLVDGIQEGGGTAASFRFFLHHGAGFAQTPGGKINRLIRFMHSFEADIYFVAHVHDQMAKRIATITADQPCKKITHREKVGLVTGAYLRSYAQGVTSYAEQRGYEPVPLGARFVEINPKSRKIKAEV